VFIPHPGFSAEVNRNIVQSEMEGGIHLDQLSEGAVLDVERSIIGTRSSAAPQAKHSSQVTPTTTLNLCRYIIADSTWGGSMLKMRFIGRGMHIEFCHPIYHTITTSRVVDIRTALEKRLT
jgi:hypothetical protein